jgi:hypothetical protein
MEVPMSPRILLVAAAVIAAAFAGPRLAAFAKDDAAAIAKAKEAVRADLKEKKCFYYYDLSYWVDAPKLKESRWDWREKPFSDTTEEGGAQFVATWSDKVGAAAGIEFVVTKHPHFKREGNLQTNYSLPFKSIGETISLTKIDDIAEGFYKEFLADSTDVIKEKCSPPKKRKFGPGEYYATAVATQKDPKVRVRKIWHVWGTTGAGIPCTWVARVTIAEKFIDTPEILQKAEDLMKATKEITDKRLK